MKLGEHTLQLLPGPERSSYAEARVEIQERLDGSVVVAYQDKVIASREAPPHPAVLRARKGARGQATERDVVRNLAVNPGEDGDQGPRAAEVDLKGVVTRPQAGNHPSKNPALIIPGGDLGSDKIIELLG